ncbi:hypothetical protein D9M69_653470 [compost metagenome]
MGGTGHRRRRHAFERHGVQQVSADLYVQVFAGLAADHQDQARGRAIAQITLVVQHQAAGNGLFPGMAQGSLGKQPEQGRQDEQQQGKESHALDAPVHLLDAHMLADRLHPVRAFVLPQCHPGPLFPAPNCHRILF